ncbi:lichenicidin A2 family type 2 lantibiotic [Butyrivibrio sp. INlla21]|uniref:lichenicidin A2 family type 2 lantibiotic n=1 Tax=Butyrivibrio sp. INlla21 TaxID=1520811 RepID=UPI0008E60291|nr:lichenicidin A2 family type 2 lantibiotic [Butyrivibrio sp. INlla21]SFU96250.1 type 2 lantibiotic, SP_1948 family [Butyrivibrio sp. INlla21]
MSKKKLDQVVGASFEDLNTEDMQNTQGGGDVNAETIVTISNLTLVGPIVSIPVVSCAK